MRLRTNLTIAATAALMAVAGGAHADEAAVKHRQAVMAAVGGHTQALAAIIKGEVPHVGDITVHAAALGELATISQHIFPTAPERAKSDLLPAAWEKPLEFKAALDAFVAAAASLAKAAAADASPRGVAPAFSEMTKTCKSCHDSFRKKS